ncbi:hypothetical protein CAEBREN_01123 [Caenorhabditis brenneri]|uniref:Uncharacterized protein n=1 Tax=Caenorhabditis brenneri TaxID=135651 RepID=G0MAJ9_CAEBE|nr:hypothetical protein CAEBREN_01123 [Caenorhabditis brenneri]
MSANKRDARLKNLQLARIKSETEEINKDSAIAAEKIEALKLKLSKLKEETKKIESSTLQAKWKNNRVLHCKDCKQMCNTTTKKPVAQKCRDTICSPCFWRRYNAEKKRVEGQKSLFRKSIGVTCPHCFEKTNMPRNLTEQNVPKSYTTLQILEICESD